MVAAAGAGMAAIDQEAVGAEPRLRRILVETEGNIDGLAPALRRLHVDLDHARIGRHLDHLDARVERRCVAFDVHLQLQLFGGCLDRGDQVEIILDLLDRRHEDAQHAIAQLDRHRGAHRQRFGDLLQCLPQLVGQRITRRHRIGLDDVGKILRCNMFERADREPQAQRGIAGEEEQVAAADLPALAAPTRRHAIAERRPALDRQHIALRRGQPLVEHPRNSCALFRIRQLRIGRADIDRQLRLTLEPVRSIFIGGHDMVGLEAKPRSDADRETLGIRDCRLAWIFDARNQVGILPDRRAVLAPVEAERPARQAFAWIPFALAVMQQAAWREPRAQFADQIIGERALGRSDRGDVPLQRLRIVDGNKRRLAPHGQPHVVCLEIGIDQFAEPIEPRPGLIGKRLGDPRRFANPRHAHLEAKLDIGGARGAGHRRGGAIMRRGADGNVPFAGQHSGGDIKADPARAGQIDLGPGVQIGEIVLDLARPLERIDVGLDLNQIAGDEARGEPEMA